MKESKEQRDRIRQRRNQITINVPLASPFEEREKGTYILLLHLVRPAMITIGKLGTFHFAAGWYTYVGSAFGAGGLRGRLKHHLSPVKKPHWHIDYLRREARLEEIWYMADAISREHEWAGELSAISGAAIPVPRFGASDCHCETHLIYFPQKPEFAEFCTSIGVRVLRWAQSLSG